MSGFGEGFTRLLRWFRQRKLLQVLAIYVAASWAILEVTDVFIDKLGLPQWFFPAAIVLLLIGLIVLTATALVEGGSTTRPLGFEAEALPKRILAGRLPILTWPRAILGGVLAFGALAGAGVALVMMRGSEEPVVAVEASANAIAVLPFRTTGESLEVWREGLMDILSANLDDVGDLRAIDTRALLSRWRSRIGQREATADEAIGVARDLGARWAIHGQGGRAGRPDPDGRPHTRGRDRGGHRFGQRRGRS